MLWLWAAGQRREGRNHSLRWFQDLVNPLLNVTGAVIIKICEIVVSDISYMLADCVIKVRVGGF